MYKKRITKTLINNIYLKASIIYILLAIISLRIFLFSSGDYVSCGDLKWGPDELNILDTHISNTFDFDSLHRYPIWKPLIHIFIFLKLSSSQLLKFSILCIKAMMGLSMFIFLYNFLRDVTTYNDHIIITSLCGGFIYSYNSMSISYLGAKLNMSLGYAIIPLIVLYFLSSVNTQALKRVLNIIITSFLFFVCVALQIHYLILISLLIFFIGLYMIIDNTSRQQLYNLLYTYCMVGGLFILLSMYWILPSLYVICSGINLKPDYILTKDMLRVFSYPSHIDVLRLMGNWLPHVSLSNNSTFRDILSYSIPITAFITLVIPYKQKHIKNNINMFTFITLPFIFLNKGLDEFGIYLLFYKIPYIGWLFRVPTKFGLILAFLYSYLISMAIFWLLERIYLNYDNNFTTKSLSLISILIIIISMAYVVDVAFIGDYGMNSFQFKKIPRYYSQVKYISDIGKRFAFYPDSPPWEYKNQVELNKMETRFIQKALEENSTELLLQFMNIRSLDYLIFRNIKINIPNLQLNRYDNLIFVRNKNPEKLFNIFNDYIFVVGNFDDVFALKDIVGNDPRYLIFLNDYINIQHFKDANNILFDSSRYNDLILLYDPSIILTPYDYTDRHDPSNLWSKAAINDPLHGEWQKYLTNRNLESWDTDYGEGLVFTWAPYILEKISSFENEDMIKNFNFEDRSLDNWDINFQNIQSLFISSEYYEGFYSLKAELHKSNWGWKIIQSPMISTKYGNVYGCEFYVKGKNCEKSHLKIEEYNEDKNIISSNYVLNIGSGTFNWKKISFNYSPKSNETVYIKLQVWHGHETTQSLPNIIWLDDIKIYDLKNYVKPNILEMPFFNDEQGDYVLFIRYFQNKDGGKILVNLDEKQLKLINTNEDTNHFIWENTNIFNLKKGKFNLVIENIEGFNAVNLFILNRVENVSMIYKNIENTLKTKNIISLYNQDSIMLEKKNITYNHNLLTILADNYKSNSTKILKYTKKSLTKYILKIKAYKPFLLTFAETFNPLWKVKVEGIESRSIPLFSLINGFMINKIGEFIVTVEYEPQKWFFYGCIISTSSLISIIIYLLFTQKIIRYFKWKML